MGNSVRDSYPATSIIAPSNNKTTANNSRHEVIFMVVSSHENSLLPEGSRLDIFRDRLSIGPSDRTGDYTLTCLIAARIQLAVHP